MKTLKILPLHPECRVPDYHQPGDAGLDVYTHTALDIAPQERVQIHTGIAMEIPRGYVGLVWDKSGNSFKRGVKVLGGVVDSGYRGEIMVCLVNHSRDVVHFDKHMPVAQMLIQKVERVKVQVVKKLSLTARGAKAYGSGDLRHKK